MDIENKKQAAQQLREQLTDMSALVLVGFEKLTVAEANDLRNRFRSAGCSYRVYKNSTIRFAIEGTQHATMTPLLKGVSAVAYHAEDPAAPARVARDYAKDNDKLKIKGGVADGTALDESGVMRLAAMPGPRELKAQLLALLNTPATHLVRVLNAPAQNLLNVLNAKKDAA
jgi:large subunit ribosomal protein L10